jgi:hypothetical protein
MKICIKCQAELDDEEIFCSECGTKQPEQSKILEPIHSSKLDQIEEIKSDCQRFKVEWNKGSSTFLANTISTLQFRITPKTSDASEAENFSIYLQLRNLKVV